MKMESYEVHGASALVLADGCSPLWEVSFTGWSSPLSLQGLDKAL